MLTLLPFGKRSKGLENASFLLFFVLFLSHLSIPPQVKKGRTFEAGVCSPLENASDIKD